MLTRRPPIVVAVLVAAALLLAACSGTDGDQLADGGQPDATAAAPSPSTTPVEAPTTSQAQAQTTEEASEPAATPPPSDSSSPAAQTATPEASEAEERLVLEPVGEDDRGNAVEDVQARLDELGYAPGPVDGAYGRLTTAAIAAYQHQAGRAPTGAADEPTVKALASGDHSFAVLQPGDRGDAVRELQQTLTDGPFDPGPVDGVYGTKTVQAVYALEKVAGLAVDGAFDGTDVHALARLEAGEIGPAHKGHDRRWVEVDLSRQLVSVYDAGSPDVPLLVSHVSTGNGERWCNDTAGCRVASTPTGSFTITRRIDGWRESSLDIGRLYNPLYFRGGIALHGALSVPTYPASHGCVRVPMHIAEYLPDLLPNGTPVDVLSA